MGEKGFVETKAQAMLDLAIVLHRAGRQHEAVEPATQALEPTRRRARSCT
jgi:hypothetical protein